jgi:hypothetical protein
MAEQKPSHRNFSLLQYPTLIVISKVDHIPKKKRFDPDQPRTMHDGDAGRQGAYEEIQVLLSMICVRD